MSILEGQRNRAMHIDRVAVLFSIGHTIFYTTSFRPIRDDKALLIRRDLRRPNDVARDVT